MNIKLDASESMVIVMNMIISPTTILIWIPTENMFIWGETLARIPSTTLVMKVMINIGRYDKNSKYNITNITRFIREKKGIFSVPYNTLYSESCSEGKIGEFFLKYRKLDSEDRNAVFVGEVERLTKALLYRKQELQFERTRRR